jgi:Arc/MetJ-type ribon-helix-helix transcriptional regulator
MMPTSVRLDAETEALLRRLARERGSSKSDVIRDALHALATGAPEAAGPYGAIADLIGVAKGEPPARARDHKQVFRDTLARRHHARHTG